MRTILTLAASLCLIAFAFGRTPETTAMSTGDTVNSTCPISGGAVKADQVVETKGGNIGVCCAKCKVKVAAWSDEKKAEYVSNLVKSDDDDKAAAKASDEDGKWKGEPYLLDTCAASGRPIDVKGTPTTQVIEGRELKFCCGGCAKAVAKEPAKWLEKVDKLQSDAQRPLYPMDVCPVSGEPLMEKGDDGKMKDVATEMIIGNRLFRVCCKMCAKKVTEDPGKYAAKLDEAAMKAQLTAYPLEVCVVNKDGKLDDESKSFMIGGRLIRTCCGGCEKKVHADPTKYVAMVDAARALKAASDDSAPTAGKDAVRVKRLIK